MRRHSIRLIVIITVLGALFLLTSAFKNRSAPKADEPSSGRHGMVSSAHPLATEAGVTVLEKGGNAFDAAVTVASVLNVVEPAMSGMGGYGTILVYDAVKKEIRFLNSSGKIPAGLDPDIFRQPNPGYRQNRRGPAAVSTPGNVHAWEAMSKTYGTLPWASLLEKAISLSEDGFVLDADTAAMIQWAFEDFPPHAQEIYGKGGAALAEGEKLIQKDLARSLRLIAAEGSRAFYAGRIAAAIDAEMKKSGGFLSLEDLERDQAEWWDPIQIKYRDCEIYTASPPSTAFPSLIRLGLMSRFDAEGLGHNTAEFLHRFIEVTKHAFWCRLKYAGDPDVTPPPLDRLLSPEYWKEETGKIDPKRARPFVYPGIGQSEGGHTTHFVVADSQGNIVTATQTLGNAFGSRIMPEGTGFWLNNSLAYCTFEPKGNPMDAHPGRRKLSGDCPTIIVRNGKPWAALGTPGGHTIGQTVPQMVMNLVDFKMDVYEAVAAPRISFVEPDKIAVERTIDGSVRDELEKRGHILRLSQGLGNGQALTIEYGRDGKPVRFEGASDPRGRGLAKGY